MTAIAMLTAASLAGPAGDRAALGGGRVALAMLAFVPLVVAAYTDERTGRIPDALVIAGCVPVATVVSLAAWSAGIAPVGRVGAGVVLMAAPVLAVHLVAPGAMGFGDVKAAAALGAVLGVLDPVLALWALCLASASAALRGVVTGRAEVPFGPSLVGSALLCASGAVLAGGELAPW